MTMLPLGDVAPVNRRAIAYVIDAAIGGAVSVVIPTIVLLIVAATTKDAVAATLVAAPLYGLLGLGWLIFYTFLQAGRGSVGMRMQGLRLVSAADGEPLGFWRALLRNVIWGLAASIVVGYFTVLFDGSGRFQGWHDKASDALMIDQRTAPQHDAYLDTTVPGHAPHGHTAHPETPVMPHAPGATAPAAPAGPAFGGVPPVTSAMPGFAAPQRPATPPMPTPPPAVGEQPAPPAPPAHGAPPFPAAPAEVPGMPEVPAPERSFAPPAVASSPQEPAPALQPASDADEEFTEQTVLSPRLRRDLPEDPLISFVPGVTQPPLVAPVAEPTPVAPVVDAPAAPVETAPPAPASDVDVDDLEDIESTRISVPGHRLVFTWDDGQRATVSGRTVFGRNPEDPDAAANIAVRDETRSLSKTHFEAGADARGGWVMDRQSTNGTTIVRDGVRIACPPGQRVPIRLGDAIEIGDRIVTIGGYV